MRIDILTLFPEMFSGVLASSMIGKAQEKGLVEFQLVNFRDFATDKHKTVDDYPYGGGGGMVLKPQPIFAAVEHLTAQANSRPRIILLCPQGELFTQEKAEMLAREQHLILICGHYEGFDERIREHLVTEEYSLGDFVLTGGEIPALAIIDSVVRLIPGALGNEQSAVTDSFSSGLLEYPQYTRPAEYRGWQVPEVLISGHHERVARWRMKEALRRTWQRRPDLLARLELTGEQKKLLAELREEADEERRR